MSLMSFLAVFLLPSGRMPGYISIRTQSTSLKFIILLKASLNNQRKENNREEYVGMLQRSQMSILKLSVSLSFSGFDMETIFLLLARESISLAFHIGCSNIRFSRPPVELRVLKIDWNTKEKIKEVRQDQNVITKQLSQLSARLAITIPG
jgi:hypothetical protein